MSEKPPGASEAQTVPELWWLPPQTLCGLQLGHNFWRTLGLLCKSMSPDIYFLGPRMWKNLKPSLSVVCRMKNNRLSLSEDLMIQSYANLGHGNHSAPSRYAEKVSCDRDVRGSCVQGIKGSGWGGQRFTREKTAELLPFTRKAGRLQRG